MRKTERKPARARAGSVPGLRVIEGDTSIRGASIAIVASRYNDDIVARLIRGCVDTLRAGGVSATSITLLRVPGAFELPFTVNRLARRGNYHAIIALGAVVRGETPHFDYICNECAGGLADVALATGVPVIFGVLTVNNLRQARARSGNDEGNKGREAAQSAIAMISLLRKLG